MRKNIFRHGIKGKPRYKELVNYAKRLFLKPFPVNLSVVVVIIAVTAIIAVIFKSCPSCNLECPKPIECPKLVCKPCKHIVCPKTNCSKPEREVVEKYTLLFVCSDGSVVNKSSHCNNKPLPFAIDSEFTATSNNITLSIDDLHYTMRGEGWGTITRIDYTIINNFTMPIVPKLLIHVYKPDDSYAKKALVHKELSIGKMLKQKSWVRRSEAVMISFSGEDTILEFELLDTIPDPDRRLAKVTMPLWEGKEE